MFQSHLELPQRCIEPAFDRAQGQVERFGYLLERQFLKLFHHDNLSQLGG